MTKIRYKSGYKYQIIEDATIQTSIIPDKPIDHDWISLTLDGLLTTKAGYAWNGPSGPAFDTKDFRRGSLFHDALYQLMGDGSLSADKWRKAAASLLVEVCKQDGMFALRRAWVFAALRLGGARVARKGDTIYEAP